VVDASGRPAVIPKEGRTDAITVAGQWRIFTAFPSIPLRYQSRLTAEHATFMIRRGLQETVTDAFFIWASQGNVKETVDGLLILRANFVVTLGRFELPTCGLGNRRSIHLSYRATHSEFTTS
jgi:hypothetical protein